MEPTKELVEKMDKGKKIVRTPRGKEEKAKMKYEFLGVECTSKITSIRY